MEVDDELLVFALELNKAYIPTRYLNAYHPFHQGGDIQNWRPRGWSTMPKEYSTSVKIYYPKFSLGEVVSFVCEAVDMLAKRLGLL